MSGGGGRGRRQWRGSKGADRGEGDVEGRERAKTVGRCGLLFPEHGPGHLPSSTTRVRGRRVEDAVTVLAGGAALFVHTRRVWQALLPAVWGSVFFPTCVVCEGSTRDHKARLPLVNWICLSPAPASADISARGMGRYGLI